MILEIKKFTEEEYNAELAKYYEKQDPPEIEVQLKSLQKRLVVNQEYEVLPEFRNLIFTYTKSLLLKTLKYQNIGNTIRMGKKGKGDLVNKDFIDMAQVLELTDTATEIFIRRYFRLQNPIIGASFAGLIVFKCREVLIAYYKTKALEAPLSIDDILSSDSSNQITLDQILSYNNWLQLERSDFDLEDYWDIAESKLDRVCEKLDMIEGYENLKCKFLVYILYLSILLKSNSKLKLVKMSKKALALAGIKDPEMVSIMETAFLDLK